jgi:Spy/CpxP family protein refolding chaperone
MKESLQLTDEQVTKIRAAYASIQPKLRALQEDTTLSPEDRRTRNHEIMEAIHQEVLAVLTPEQLLKHSEEVRRGSRRPQ